MPHDDYKDPHSDQEPEERITITLEDGAELDCEVIGVFDAEGRTYIALQPLDSDDILLYRFAEDSGDLSDMETDEEYKAASEVFLELFFDEFEDDDFEEDDFDDDDFFEDDFDDELFDDSDDDLDAEE